MHKFALVIWLIGCLAWEPGLSQGLGLYKFYEQVLDKNYNPRILEGMKDANDRVVIPPNFEYIAPFEHDTITFAKRFLPYDEMGQPQEGGFQAITRSGFLFFEFPNTYNIESYDGQYFRYFDRKKYLYGYLNRNGEVVLKPRYGDARDFNEGAAAVEVRKKNGWRYTYIDRSGKEIFDQHFIEAYDFSEGIAVVKLENNQYAFLKRTGQIVRINDAFDHIFDVKEGLAVVQRKSNNQILFGVINIQGQTVIEPKYEFIDNFDQGSATFIDNGKSGMLAADGSILIKAEYDEIYRFDQRHYLFEVNGYKGLMDLDRNIIVPPHYKQIGFFIQGLCPVQQNYKWGFVNAKGEQVVPCTFADYDRGKNNVGWLVKTFDSWLVVSNKLDSIRLPNYEQVLEYIGYTAPVLKNGLWGFINIHGEEVTEPRFDEIVPLDGKLFFGRSPVKNNEEPVWSLVDMNGSVVTKERYNNFAKFSNGLAAVQVKGKWGFIDLNGVEVVAPKYDLVRNFSNQYAAVWIEKTNEWTLIDKEGNEAIPGFTQMPDLSEDNPQNAADSLAAIRLQFPLYKFDVVGDYDGTAFAVVDSHIPHNKQIQFMNARGKLIEGYNGRIVTKKADLYPIEKMKNYNLKVVSLPGHWIKLDDDGRQVN